MLGGEMTDSQPEGEGVNLDGCHLIVSWSCLLLLLTKCQRDDCADNILTSNLEVSRNGTGISLTSKK